MGRTTCRHIEGVGESGIAAEVHFRPTLQYWTACRPCSTACASTTSCRQIRREAAAAAGLREAGPPFAELRERSRAILDLLQRTTRSPSGVRRLDRLRR